MWGRDWPWFESHICHLPIMWCWTNNPVSKSQDPRLWNGDNKNGDHIGLLWGFSKVTAQHTASVPVRSVILKMPVKSVVLEKVVSSLYSYWLGRYLVSIAWDMKAPHTWQLPLWSKALVREEFRAAEQLGSVPGVHKKLGTGLRENCFGDKEVAILAFSQEQFTDGTERTFSYPLPVQIHSSCFLLNCPWSPPLDGPNISLRYVFSP